eukprot:1193543-Prorocentrum_minimum.AAC.2
MQGTVTCTPPSVHPTCVSYPIEACLPILVLTPCGRPVVVHWFLRTSCTLRLGIGIVLTPRAMPRAGVQWDTGAGGGLDTVVASISADGTAITDVAYRFTHLEERAARAGRLHVPDIAAYATQQQRRLGRIMLIKHSQHSR